MSLNVVIAILQLNFLFMSYTVERAYCKGPLDIHDDTPLVKTTIRFSEQYNPLFLDRPDWVVQATCIHAKCFWMLYGTILVTSLGDWWHRRWIQNVLLLGLGAKWNAVLFYHYMEFTSDTPPPNILAYFAAEGSYMVSIGLVLYKIFSTPCQNPPVTTIATTADITTTSVGSKKNV
jgi:hypothetical protein